MTFYRLVMISVLNARMQNPRCLHLKTEEPKNRKRRESRIRSINQRRFVLIFFRVFRVFCGWFLARWRLIRLACDNDNHLTTKYTKYTKEKRRIGSSIYNCKHRGFRRVGVRRHLRTLILTNLGVMQMVFQIPITILGISLMLYQSSNKVEDS